VLSVRGPWRAALAVAATTFAVVAYSWLLLPDVRALRTRNPATTAFMAERQAESARQGRRARVVWRWTSYNRIASSLKRAVILSEDAAFWSHDGIDIKEVQASLEESLRTGEPPRGASTITQQLAKNLYLSSSYSPARKLVELMIARRLEAELSKTRIFEIYLNVAEWGDGVWGAEAAARTHFGKSAADLSLDESALLAGALINPRIYSPSRPNARLLSRQRIILERLAQSP
jgi:monofunctional biosynthetic peptidoglycan transglycosylase